MASFEDAVLLYVYPKVLVRKKDCKIDFQKRDKLDTLAGGSQELLRPFMNQRLGEFVLEYSWRMDLRVGKREKKIETKTVQICVGR